MLLHIAPVHFLSLSLTNYGNSSQGEETSSHLQTLPWLKSPKVSRGKILWGSQLPVSVFLHSFPGTGSSLILNQSFAVVYRQQRTWPDI